MMPHAASQDALRIGHGQVIYTCQRNDICGGPPDEIKAACLSASWPLFYSAQALAVSALGNSMTEIQCANGVPPGVPRTRFVVTPVAPSRREPANGRCSLRYARSNSTGRGRIDDQQLHRHQRSPLVSGRRPLKVLTNAARQAGRLRPDRYTCSDRRVGRGHVAQRGRLGSSARASLKSGLHPWRRGAPGTAGRLRSTPGLTRRAAGHNRGRRAVLPAPGR